MTLTEIAKQACSMAKQQNWQLNGEIQDIYLKHLENQGAPENHLDMFIAAYDSFLYANGQAPLTLPLDVVKRNVINNSKIFAKV